MDKKVRKQIDWEKIEKEFRAGQLSIREIASQNGCAESGIRRKMKELGVERDLTEQIAQKVRNSLVREEMRTSNPASEKEIIETAAARSVDVVRSHRIKISSGVKTVAALFDQLATVTEKREEIIGEIEAETSDDENSNRRNIMLKAVALQANSSTAVSLSLALKNLVGLERQAFGIKDDSVENPSEVINSITRRIIGGNKWEEN